MRQNMGHGAQKYRRGRRESNPSQEMPAGNHKKSINKTENYANPTRFQVLQEMDIGQDAANPKQDTTHITSEQNTSTREPNKEISPKQKSKTVILNGEENQRTEMDQETPNNSIFEANENAIVVAHI